MATIRGRMAKVGGMAVADGASGRTETPTTSTGGRSTILRPAYTMNAGIFKPTMPASFTTVFDPHSVLFWRIVLVGLAVGYIWSWHVRLPVVGRVKL